MNLRSLSQKYKTAVIVSVVLCSGFVSILLYPIIGTVAGLFIIMPLLIGAYLFEFRTVLLIWAISLLANSFMLTANGYSIANILTVYGGITGLVAFFTALIVTAEIQKLNRRLSHEAEEQRSKDSEMQNRTEELASLQRASLQLTSTLELNLILQTILENASKLVHADDVHVFFYDGKQISFGAALWAGQEQHEPFRDPRPDGITYSVARKGEAIIVPDTDHHPLYLNSSWGGAIASLPLQIGQKVCGVMNIAFTKPHVFQDDELRILSLFADQAAIAVQNAQLYETVRQQASKMELGIARRTVELLDAKERAETVFNNSFDAILVLNPQGTIEQANSAFESLFGFEEGNYLQEPMVKLLHPGSQEAFLKQLGSRQSARAEILLQKRDGSPFMADIALAPIPNQDASAPDVICSIRDISQRNQAEEQQRAMTRGLRTVLAVANELISCPDVDTTLRQAVESARNALGLERCGIFLEQDDCMQGTYGTDVRGQTTDEHNLRVPMGEAWRQRVAHLRPEEAQWIVLDDNTRTEWDGKSRVPVGKGWVVVTHIPFTDGSRGFLFNDTILTNTALDETQQEIVAVYCSLLGKIVERKQAEERVQRALENETELSEIKSRIITTISHEFRTPMAIIQASSQLLKYYSNRMDEEKRWDHFSKIESQIQQMTTLMENVLTISRSETGNLTCNRQPLDAAAFCQTIADEINATAGNNHSIIFSHQGDCENCTLDEKLVRQIVTNLLTNAVKYSPAGSSIHFDLACKDGQIVIQVKDEGIGIPKADQKHLFQDFHRARNVGAIAGTGLGLSIIKRAAEAHGGTATFESIEGVSTTFTVTLSTQSAKSEPSQVAEP